MISHIHVLKVFRIVIFIYFLAVHLPIEVVCYVYVALCSGQQEHDEGVFQVTLKLYCLVGI